eukprot:scaffold34612_cov165-Amphora_coffeaeformis.AAC.19
MPNTINLDDPAAARKRRIGLRAARSDDDDSQDSSSKRPRLSEDEDEDSNSDTEGAERRKPSLRGIKNQARYEPGVPMTKEELAAWRKEARRVRNRESAAASRQKTKERIDHLEGKVAEIQAKYDAALRRIAELEGQSGCVPALVPFVSVPPRVSPQPSPKISPASTPVIPQDPISLDVLSEDNLHQAASQLLLPSHDIHPSMILRPTAVCV